MIRALGWEKRLAEQLRNASIRQFDLQTWNCARFAHACAEAVSGRPIPFRWKGSLKASADAVLPRVDARMARRGDIVLAEHPETLGVCVGRVAAFVTTSGLLTIPMRQVVAAWSV